MGPPHRGTRRRRHPDQAQRGKAPQLLPRPLQPVRCRTRRIPHLHLHRERRRRRPDQQLDEAGGAQGRDAGALRRLHARPHHVRRAVLHGPHLRPGPEARRPADRLGLRRALHADHDPHGHPGVGKDRGRELRALPPLRRRPARAGPGRRGVAVQRHQVHLPVPGDQGDLVLRLRLRRQRHPGQEVLRPAHRHRDGEGRGLDGRAHAHPQAHLPGGQVLPHRRRLPVCLRQDQPRHDHPDSAGVEGRGRRRRHRLDAPA